MKKNPIQLEENINKLRRFITGNMIGVISHLYKDYPGIISMEDLSQNTVEADRKQFEGNLARPLEFALYRKFIKENKVPPMLSEIITLREQKNKITKIGIVNFVSESDTSKTCPACKEKAYSNNAKYESDKKIKVFECEKCGFNNKNNPMEYESLDSNDKVAGFNIAKQGFENLNKQ